MPKYDMRLLIEHKRLGRELSAEDWRAVVEHSVHRDADEAQIAALLMACVFAGMSVNETIALTNAMVESGDVITFTQFSGAVDKHSTGGVGDTASLVLVPLLAACGERVAKLSGRALGHTGGTLDKLESVPGFRVELSPAEFESTIARVGCSIAAQSSKLVPADKILYALRDRTGTVSCIGLIAASIVSKKIAAGAERIAFDVKVGSGAFMKTLEEARLLASMLVQVARGFGRLSVAIITDMNQPLSPHVGTGVEMVAARDFLRGDTRPDRLRAIVKTIAHALLSTRLSALQAEATIEEALSSSVALSTFEAMIELQGGDVERFRLLQSLPESRISAPAGGYVAAIDCVRVGNLARELVARHGAFAGVRIDASIGDRVEAGQALGVVFGEASAAAQAAETFQITSEPVEPPPLVYDIISAG